MLAHKVCTKSSGMSQNSQGEGCSPRGSSNQSNGPIRKFRDDKCQVLLL